MDWELFSIHPSSDARTAIRANGWPFLQCSEFRHLPDLANPSRRKYRHLATWQSQIREWNSSISREFTSTFTGTTINLSEHRDEDLIWVFMAAFVAGDYGMSGHSDHRRSHARYLRRIIEQTAEKMSRLDGADPVSRIGRRQQISPRVNKFGFFASRRSRICFSHGTRGFFPATFFMRA